MAIKYIRREVTHKKKGEHWSEKQKYEAVAMYKLLGSLTETAKQLSIPLDTMKYWHIQDWWKDYELEVAQAGRAGLTNKLSKIRDRALLIVEDRLENGEFYIDKKGDISRRPVGVVIANKVLTDSIDRTILLEKLNQEHKQTITAEKIADRLLSLQEFFKKGSKRPVKDFIDAEVINADSSEIQEGQREIRSLDQELETEQSGSAQSTSEEILSQEDRGNSNQTSSN